MKYLLLAACIFCACSNNNTGHSSITRGSRLKLPAAADSVYFAYNDSSMAYLATYFHGAITSVTLFYRNGTKKVQYTDLKMSVEHDTADANREIDGVRYDGDLVITKEQGSGTKIIYDSLTRKATILTNYPVLREIDSIMAR